MDQKRLEELIDKVSETAVSNRETPTQLRNCLSRHRAQSRRLSRMAVYGLDGLSAIGLSGYRVTTSVPVMSACTVQKNG